MQLFETVVHDDKANILNSISTNIYLESFNLWSWPVFNFALSCQSTGTGFQMFHYWFLYFPMD